MLVEARGELETAPPDEVPRWAEKIEALEKLFRGKGPSAVESETGDPLLDELLRRRRAGEDVTLADMKPPGVG